MRLTRRELTLGLSLLPATLTACSGEQETQDNLAREIEEMLKKSVFNVESLLERNYDRDYSVHPILNPSNCQYDYGITLGRHIEMSGAHFGFYYSPSHNGNGSFNDPSTPRTLVIVKRISQEEPNGFIIADIDANSPGLYGRTDFYQEIGIFRAGKEKELSYPDFPDEEFPASPFRFERIIELKPREGGIFQTPINELLAPDKLLARNNQYLSVLERALALGVLETPGKYNI